MRNHMEGRKQMHLRLYLICPQSHRGRLQQICHKSTKLCSSKKNKVFFFLGDSEKKKKFKSHLTHNRGERGGKGKGLNLVFIRGIRYSKIKNINYE